LWLFLCDFFCLGVNALHSDGNVVGLSERWVWLQNENSGPGLHVDIIQQRRIQRLVQHH